MCVVLREYCLYLNELDDVRVLNWIVQFQNRQSFLYDLSCIRKQATVENVYLLIIFICSIV